MRGQMLQGLRRWLQHVGLVISEQSLGETSMAFGHADAICLALALGIGQPFDERSVVEIAARRISVVDAHVCRDRLVRLRQRRFGIEPGRGGQLAIAERLLRGDERLEC